jgi:hypothetical protein
VTTVYVDTDAIVDASRSAAGPDEGALRSLRFLREAGHDVVLVVDPSSSPPWAAPGGEWSSLAPEAVPVRPPSASWYLTSDVERCRGRSALLRTVLIGSTPGPAAIHRCDALARDVSAAALEILAAEAMQP